MTPLSSPHHKPTWQQIDIIIDKRELSELKREVFYSILNMASGNNVSGCLLLLEVLITGSVYNYMNNYWKSKGRPGILLVIKDLSPIICNNTRITMHLNGILSFWYNTFYHSVFIIKLQPSE